VIQPIARWFRGHAHAVSMLSREAARTSRQWQTYASRAGFSGVLLSLFLGLMYLVSGLPGIDASQLSYVGRYMFVFFTILQQLLIFGLAPMLAANAMSEEMDDRTLDILALTRLRPTEILVGKVLSRVLVLALVSLGALPVVSVIASLGGVSVAEVLATSAHHLATIVFLSFLGGFYALFTRNALLATMAASVTATVTYLVPSSVYATLVWDPADAVHLSPLLGSTAIDGWALLPVLAQLPLVALIVFLGSTLFDLHIGRAGSKRLFAFDTWHTRVWGVGVGVVAIASVGVLPAAGLCWTLQRSGLAALGPAGEAALHVVAQGYVWLWMLAATTAALWTVLRITADIVEGLDRTVRRNRLLAERTGVPSVWANPVAWYEARPHRWARVAVPLLFASSLAGFMLVQSAMFFIPGVLVLAGMTGTGTAVAATVWMVTRSVAADRRDGTLEVLLTSPLSGMSIVTGKLAGAVVAGLPMLLLSGPLYGVGILYLDAFFPSDYRWFTLIHGAAVWMWTFPAWLALVTLGMAVSLRTNNLRSAFVTTIGAALLWFLGAGLAGRIWGDVPWIALPMRIASPALAGSHNAFEYLASALGLIAASGAGLTGIAWRLRRWLVPMVALLFALPALADDLSMTATPLGDGIARMDRWLPIEVEIANAGPGTRGTLSWVAGGGGTTWRREVDLPEGARKSVSLAIRPGVMAGKTRVLLETADDRSVEVEVALRGIADSAVAIAVLGDDPVGINGIAVASTAPPPGPRPRPTVDEPRPVRTGLVALADAPTHTSGWDTFDQVVWYRADPTRLDPRQLFALRAWVADGGNLTLVVTDTAPAVRASPLADWLPAELGALRDLPDLDGLLTAVGAPPAGPIAVAAPAASARPGAWIRASAADGSPLWSTGRYGLGTVTLLLADPRVAPLSAVPRDGLWRAVLSLPATGVAQVPADLAAALHAIEPPLRCALGKPSYGDPVETWSAPVRTFLDDIPGVAPLPLTWLAAFSALYLLIIGPVDWFVLRRLRREPLTWVTYPTSIAVFSAVALIGTSWSKGSQAVVRRLEIVDALPGTGLWRGSTFIGVFSTRKTTVALTGGFDDSVVIPLENPGFADQPQVEVSEGPGSFRWHAETWTLAHARSAWVAEAPGQLTVTPMPDGSFRLHNGLANAIGPVWIERSGEHTGCVPSLAAGETRSAPTTCDGPGPPPELLDVTDNIEESPDLGHGHLEGRATHAMVFAVLPEPIEPIALTGLVPMAQGTTVLRVPVFGTGGKPASLTTEVRVTAGALPPESVRDRLAQRPSMCFEQFSAAEDRTLHLAFEVVDHQVATQPSDDPLATCLLTDLQGAWMPTDDHARVEVDFVWTVRDPGSPL
jgi:ABC-type transport system involved in multi-copper enzyme maturation permease subunit